jgi:2-iminobutanoate/2-iminopropanoate deaminase
MTRAARQPDGVAVPKPPYSPVVVAGDLVFTAGQVASDPSGTLIEGSIAEQTEQVMRNLQACLAAAGCTMGDIVKTTVFLADLADFEGFNAVYAEHLSAPYPARSTVQVGLAAGLLVEVEAIARRPSA